MFTVIYIEFFSLHRIDLKLTTLLKKVSFGSLSKLYHWKQPIGSETVRFRRVQKWVQMKMP